MKILGIDSSGLVASVAIVEDNDLKGEYTVNYKKTHSQTLLPMLDEVAKMIELDLNTIDAIAVSGGPGSFTGLRIGSATAKGLGLALKKPLIPVPTVDALAYNLYEYIRSGKGRDVRGWLLMLEAARQFEMEAEATAGLDSAGKLAFVLEKLNAFAAGQGLPFDAEKCRRQVEEDIAFTRQVNVK